MQTDLLRIRLIRAVVLGSTILLVPHAAASAATEPPAELGLPILQRYTAEVYRAHNEVTASVRGPDGRLWFGSIVSLIEFDGVTWRKHAADTPYVWVAHPARDGRVYVAGDNEFGLFEPGGESGMTYRSLVADVPETIKPLGWMRSIVERPDGIYFTSGRGVIRWRDGAVRSWPMDEVRMMTLLEDGADLYLHHPGVGLLELVDEEWVVRSRAPELGPNQRSWMARLDERTLVVGMFRAGLLRFDGEALVPWPNEAQAILAESPVTCGRVLRDGSLAVGTATSGLVVLSPEGRLLHHIDERAGLNQNTVFSLAEDDDGGLWMTTRNGIARWEPALRASTFDERNGYSAREPTSILRHAGRLYVVQIGGQVLQLLPADAAQGVGARFEQLPGLPDTVYHAASHPAGLLLASDGALSVWDGQRASVALRVRGAPKRVLVHSAPPHRVFVGTDWGVLLVEPEGGSWRSIAEWPFDSEVQELAQDLDGSIWAGLSRRGYARLSSPAAGASWSDSVPVVYDRERGVPADHAWFLARATPFGATFNSEKESFRFDAALDRIVLDERLLAPDATRMVASIQAVAPGGVLWAAGSRPGNSDPYAPAFPFGFFREQGEALRWHDARAAWREIVGPQGPFGQFAEPAPSGVVLWAASASSLVRFEYSEPAPPPRRFEVEIESSVRGGQPLPAEGVRLPHSRRPLQFRFAARRYDLGANVRYESRLVGFDDDWSEPTAERSVTFPALGGGKYVFELRGRDADGNVSEIARRTLSVAPPPYFAWWAWVAYLLAAAALFQLAMRGRLRHAQAETRRLESLVAERTHDLALAKGAAEQANRAKSRFLANLSHELRTPLNVILGFAQILDRDPEVSEGSRERLRLIRSSGNHLLGLIDDVLDLAKVEAGRVELRPEPFALRDLLRDLEAAHAPRAAERGLRFELRAHDLPAGRVVGDPRRLRQVLDNLLGNALKFTRAGGVVVSVRAGLAARVRFEVEDTGPGIGAADLARLFHPFEQATDGRPPEPGTGLGLSIAQHLVRLMEGRIEVESAPGHGSRFHFEIPLPSSAETAVRAESGALVGCEGPSRHVLVVDDLENNRRVLREMLAALGCEVSDAQSGEDALASAAARQPDLALVDLRMPGMDGLELARRMRASHAAVKLVATSASTLVIEREEVLRAGYDAFLPKPVREEELVELLGKLLGMTWRREPVAEPAVAASDALDARPTAEDLAPLREAASRGDVLALREALSALRARRPELSSFVAGIEDLAGGYRMQEIRRALG